MYILFCGIRLLCPILGPYAGQFVYGATKSGCIFLRLKNAMICIIGQFGAYTI